VARPFQGRGELRHRDLGLVCGPGFSGPRSGSACREWPVICRTHGMATRRPPRLSRDCYRGVGRFFLTICVSGRRRIFISELVVDPVKNTLLRTALDYRFAVTAFCFMPDHFHGIFESLADDCCFTKFANMVKQRTAFEYRRLYGEALWQDSYFDRVIRSDESSWDVVAYVLANPCRAGLCESAIQYSFSGSSLYSLADLCAATQSLGSSKWRP